MKTANKGKPQGTEKRAGVVGKPAILAYHFQGVKLDGKDDTACTVRKTAQQAEKVEASSGYVSINMLRMMQAAPEGETFDSINDAVCKALYWGRVPKGVDSAIRAKYRPAPKTWRNVGVTIRKAEKAGLDFSEYDTIYGAGGLHEAVNPKKDKDKDTGSGTEVEQASAETARTPLGKQFDTYPSDVQAAVTELFECITLAGKQTQSTRFEQFIVARLNATCNTIREVAGDDVLDAESLDADAMSDEEVGAELALMVHDEPEGKVAAK